MEFDYLDALIEADLEETIETAGDDYRHVWVVVEVDGEYVLPGSLAALGQGRDIADQFGVYLFVLLLGYSLDEGLAGGHRGRTQGLDRQVLRGRPPRRAARRN